MMKTTASIMCLCVLLLPTSQSQGTEPSGTHEAWSDPEGDQEFSIFGAGTGSSLPRWEGADVQGLEIIETRTDLRFLLDTGDLTGATEILLWTDTITHAIDFNLGGQAYGIWMARGDGMDGRGYVAFLQTAAEGSLEFKHVANLDFSVDEPQGTYDMLVPKDLLRTATGAYPINGDKLQDIIVTSWTGTFLAPPWTTSDRAPDDGAWEYTLVAGPEQEGHVRLTSNAPYRTSNGAARTYVFDIEATNTGAAPDTFAWRLQNQPESWDVHYADRDVHLDAGETRSFAVLVTVPFAHQHGALETALLELQSQHEESAVGRIEIGVIYTAIPQPAGHHNTLWIHTWDDGTGAAPYMSTQPPEEGDSGPAAPPTPSFEARDEYADFSWAIDLRPELTLGLELDQAGTGSIRASFQATGAMPSSTISGILVLVDQAGIEVPIAEVEPRGMEAALHGDIVEYESAIEPTAGTARYSYEHGSNLRLWLNLVGDVPLYFLADPAAPSLLPGGSIELPLREFYDNVADVFAGLTGLHVEMAGNATRRAAPDSTFVFSTRVTNEALDARDLLFHIISQHEDWVVAVDPAEISLGTEVQVVVDWRIAIPSSARDGEGADFSFVAEDKETGARSVVHATILVDASAPLVQEADADASFDESVEGSSAGFFLTGLLVWVAAARRFSRRH